MSTFNYRPPATVRAFMRDPSLVRAIVGPIGSGKTTGCLFEILRRSAEQAPTAEGVRPTRWAIIRNTVSQLRNTVLPDMQTYYGPLMTWKTSHSTVQLRFDLADGTKVEADLLFIPLEEQDDVRRLLSLQLTGAFVEEFREVDTKILSPLMGRIGRYPSVGVKPSWSGVIMSSNPYPDGSEWHRLFELVCPKTHVMYRQPSGLSAEAENVENLPQNYYERLCEGATPEFIDVAVHGYNGQDLSGSAVFKDSFDYFTHTVADTQPMEGRTFVIGMDTDRNGAALICQRGPGGQLIVHKEVFVEGTGLETFITGALTPVMHEHFTGTAFVIADPSSVTRSSITEESQKQAIERLGYKCVLAATNKIEPRLRAIESLFMSASKGKPGILISQSGCPTLINSLLSQYKYPRSARGELAPKPQKLHPWSDLVDALGYVALGFNDTRVAGKPFGVGAARPVNSKPAPSSLAWT